MGWGGTVLIAFVVGALAIGAYYWLSGPDEAPAGHTQAIVAPGGFQASISGNDTITVGLEIRNDSASPVTVLSARVVPPAGLTSVAVVVAPATEEGTIGFSLGGDLPESQPVQLGTEALDRNAVVAARFTVDCDALGATDGPTGEQIFVTVEQDGVQREEELTPPVVGEVPWLTATAERVCSDPVSTEPPEPPLPPLPTDNK